MDAQPYRSRVDFLVLGPLRVSVDGASTEITSAKERTLLAHLVAHAGEVVPTADLIDSLWGEHPPRSAAKAMQTYVLRLRDRLEPGRAGAGVIVTDGPGYRLAVTARDTDAGRFTELCRLAAEALAGGRPESALDACNDALQLWRGPAYAGCEHTAFGQAESQRLGTLRLRALETRAEAYLALDRPTATVPELEQLVVQHPLREHLWALLMLAHYRAGGQAEALGTYERARSVLAEELGVDPGPELRELQARVLGQDEQLLHSRRTTLPDQLRDTSPMIGRDDQLATLRDGWHRTVAGAPVTAVLRGPAGAGAQRLAAALAQEAAADGCPVMFVEPGEVPPPSPGGPWLLVADRHRVTRPDEAMLVLLTGSGQPAPEGAVVLDLAPLPEDDVRRVAAAYVGAVHAAEAASEILAGGPGWPGRVHLEATRIARLAATRSIEQAAGVADESRVRLATARADVSEGIISLGELSEPGLPDGCPWRGLTSYGVDDAPWYAGRERLVAELLARVASSRLVALVGASGSGKSSALHAGVLAGVARNVLPASSGWHRVTMRPGRHPMKELARRALGSQPVDVADVLARLLDGHDPRSRTLLVIDQLEELWTACDDPGERAAFVDTVTELVRDPRSSTTVMVAVRADYLDRVAEHADLAALLTDGTVLVGAPTPAEVRRAVERPAARGGLSLEDGLAETVVTDAGSEPGLLPLLSVALAQLWERRSGDLLTYAAYVATGGIAGAIGRLAEEVWADLSPDEQRAVRTLLLRLAGPGDSTTVVGRRVPLQEAEALGIPDVRALVDRLADARLLTVSDSHVEVAHEALFREWPRLRGWLYDDAAARGVQQRLSVAAAEWASEQRDPTHLWTGTRLLSAQEFASAHPDEVTSTEHDFLDHSRREVEAEETAVRARAAATATQNRRLRLLLLATVALLLAALVAGVVAVVARRAAEDNEGAARRAATRADARRLAADALNADRPELGLLMAMEAVKRDAGPETYGALLTLLTRTPEAVTRFRVPRRFLRIAASADGRTVYLTDNADTLYAVDSTSGTELWRSRSDSGAQWGRPVADPGGAWVAVPTLGSDAANGTPVLQVLDAASGMVRHLLTWSDLRRVAPDADGRLDDFAVPVRGGRMVLGTSSRAFVVDPAQGRVERAIPVGEHDPFLSTIDDTTVVLSPPGGGVDLLDVTTGRIRHREGADFATGVGSGAVVTSSRRTLAGGITTVLRLRRAADWSPRGRPVQVDGQVLEVRRIPATDSLAVLHEEVVEVRDAATLAVTSTIDANSGVTMGAAPAGRGLLWVAGRDGTAVALDFQGRRGLLRHVAGGPSLGVGDADAAGRYAVWTPQYDDRPNPARLADLANGRDLHGELPIPQCSCQVGAVSVSDDGVLASGALEEFLPDFSGFVEDRGRVVLWDVGTGAVARTVHVPWQPTGAVLGADHRRVLVVGMHGYGVYDTSSGDPVWTRSSSEVTMPEWGRSSGELAPDGSRVVVLRNDSVILADASTGETLATTSLADAEGLRRAAFSPDGATLVLGSLSGRLYFLDATDLEQVAPPRVVTAGFVLDLAFSADRRMLAVMGTDGDVTLFDTETWQPYGGPVVDHLGWGFLAFDGLLLRIYGELGEPRELSIDPAEWLAAACRAANTRFTAEESAVVLPGERVAPTCE